MDAMTKTALFLLAGALAWGQPNQQAAVPPPPSHQYLKVQQYTAEEDANLLKLYEGLRVADVIDGLDAVGLPEVTMMDKHIRPLWRDEQKITHRIHGIALTVRLVPAQATAPKFASHAAERPWEAQWYKNQGEYSALVRPGTILVVDNQARD